MTTYTIVADRTTPWEVFFASGDDSRSHRQLGEAVSVERMEVRMSDESIERSAPWSSDQFLTSTNGIGSLLE